MCVHFCRFLKVNKYALLMNVSFSVTNLSGLPNMAVVSKKALSALVASIVFWGPSVSSQAISAELPKYVALARELVENTKPENNRYSLGSQFVSFPGDVLSSKHAVRADCSGLLLALLERAEFSTQSRMEYLPGKVKRRARPAAEDFVYSIEAEKGFVRIRDARNIKPGDLLAHAMLNVEDQRETATTGHVFLIDSAPRLIEPRAPIVAGTQQFEVSVIDSNDEYLGPDDTRLADPSNKIKGLGRGSIRIYLDLNGELVGWAKTFKTATKFYSYDPRFPSDTKARKAAVGRPIEPNRAL
jgi:hypothetical protein